MANVSASRCILEAREDARRQQFAEDCRAQCGACLEGIPAECGAGGWDWWHYVGGRPVACMSSKLRRHEAARRAE